MRDFRIICLTPPGSADPAIAIAASRAGALGVLDLELAADEQAAVPALARMGRLAGSSCGVKLDGRRVPFLDAVTRDLPGCVRTVILTPGDPEALRDRVRGLRGRDVAVLLEATSMEEADLGALIEVDGLIAKGHEAGGRVSDETTFILLQRFLTRGSLPVWAQGGIGLHTAAAVYVAGASGIVLDAQLLLTRESPLPRAPREALGRMDGSETVTLGSDLGEEWRMYDRPGLRPCEEVRALFQSPGADSRPRAEVLRERRRAILERAGWEDPRRQLLIVGQDAAFAAPLARRFRCVAGVIEGMRQSIDDHVRAARALRPLDEGSPLARAHGTRHPIVQGPMTRVSDTATFALEVARGGGLPFLALALMRAPEARALLQETARVLGNRPWGVGILGFVPLELRQEQLEEIRAIRPPFALIAGGRPDQARSLENDGIATYLHVPSPGLLKLFLEGGSRRFVFEGRECGGHVGPRSSFVLWNSMVDVLLESLPAEGVGECHVLFAAGVHDALSASMVAALAAPLAERGARVGVLLGTAYLFTREAVATGAIVEGFQRSAVQCTRTVLLETGPGHATRCVDSPFAGAFERERRRLLAEGRSPEEIRNALEALNLGRLRVASKGVDRNPDYGTESPVPRLTPLSPEEQRLRGMYMIGQVAALRDTTCSIEDLHRDVSVAGTELLLRAGQPALARAEEPRREKPSDVAIIGMACLLPKAPDLSTYWRNILGKVDAITEVPANRWDWKRYFDPDPRARDRVYSKWGGFLDDVPFDPVRYGMPPNSLPSIEPVQLLTLEAARAALHDAGYLDRPFPRKRTSVILGAGGGISELGNLYAFRSQLPAFVGEPDSDLLSRLPEWTEDSFPGILLNVAAGRVANRFDLGGINCTIDAACASSLAAIYLAVKDLETGSSDLVLAGGIDSAQNPFMFLCFSKTRAHSPRGRCRTFDESADGIVISEGIAILVLKRLQDAERDGDRIYAVIKSIAASSDGRDKGLTAPRPEGQALALERAYAKAGLSPATVGLIEAHGTGTVAGDQAEVTTLRRVFEAAGAGRQSCAIGSVKSMIGHTKCAAGVAGMAKVALALYHRVLPPTLHVEKPNSRIAFQESPFYVSSEARPWLDRPDGHPRRAGVSAFGFGGTNFHAVLEEHTGDVAPRPAPAERWPAELFLWRGRTGQEILAEVERVESAIARGASPLPADLSYTLWQRAAERGDDALALAIVAGSIEDLTRRLATARERLGAAPASLFDPSGIYFTETPFGRGGKVAFLFPGQGSQYPNMLRDLALHFPEVREPFERADRALASRLAEPLSRRVFPPPAFTPEEEISRQQALTVTNIAQPALGAAGLAVLRLLSGLGVRPDMVGGHSYGEYVALCAAGVIDAETLATLSEARGRCILDAAREDLGTMAAVPETAARVVDLLSPLKDVWIANLNAPRQTVISGTRAGVQQAIDLLKSRGVEARPLPVACAFHSPVIAPARDRFAEILSSITFRRPRLEVFANSQAAPYPHDPQRIAALLADHLVQPVRFGDEVEAMHRAGARLFVEVGPKSVLTGLAQQILGDRPHLAAASDVAGRHGIVQLLHLLGQLAAHGVPVRLERLYRGRATRELDLGALEEEKDVVPLSPTTWLVDGASARPLNQPKRELQTVQAPRRGSEPLPAAPLTAPAPATTPEAPLPAAAEEDASIQVMLQFQQLMGRFLETQKSVMQAYLAGRSLSADLPAGQPVGDAELRGLAQAAFATASDAVVSPLPIAPEVNPASADAQEPTRRLLAIVSERTGYPQEMLDLDAGIEADLGIDSIKRVEILGALQSASSGADQERLREEMERLSRAKTLRGVLEIAAGPAAGSGPSPAARPVTPAAAPPDRQAASRPAAAPAFVEVPRFLLRPVETPIDAAPALDPGGRIWLITDDGRGVARALAETIRGRGGNVALLDHGSETAEREAGWYTTDFGDAREITGVLDLIRRRQGPIGRLVHLLPLADAAGPQPPDLEAWRRRLALETRSLFCMARALRPDLEDAAGAGLVAAASCMGGAFGLEPGGGAPFFPGQGSIAGVVKTLAVEWPGTRCKAIDFDVSDTPADRAGALVRELASTDREVAVGYAGGRRRVLRPVAAEPPEGGAPSLAPGPDWVFLVTGGARGITARVAIALAERYRPTLVLVGRSPLPEAEEAAATAGLTSPQDLKAALIADMRRAGCAVTPSAVETGYRRLCQDRDMQRNITAMRQAGATVRYVQADVRDEAAFGALLEEIERAYGRLDGAIHGAGIIEDRLVEDKSVESFDRVVGTKLDGAFLFSRLPPATLKLLVLFSSVAGCFGNRGQVDYAAANEALNSLAIDLDRRWPGRVVSINWGPWQGGMASAEVQQRFAERGVQLVPEAAGAAALLREIELGRKGEVEVILGDGPWRALAVDASRVAARAVRPAPGPGRSRDVELPLLNGLPLRAGPSGAVELTRVLDPANDLYLLDHRLDGRPVLPAAMAMELFAEVASRGWPEMDVLAIRDYRVLNGVVMENGPRPIRVVARAETQPDPERLELAVDVCITDPDRGRSFHQGTVVLGERLPSPPAQGLRPLHGARPFPMSVEKAYELWLFHGPVFQGITRVDALGEDGISGTVAPSSPARCVRDANGAQWIIDPVVVDSAFQLGILYARSRYDMTPLPARFRSFRRFAPFGAGPVRCEFRSEARAGGHVLEIQIAFHDQEGRLLGLLEDMELSCSRELNRLAELKGRVR